MWLKFGLLIIAYLFGSIPFSVILGRMFKGIDVRDHGSGNPGGTNALRFLGKPLGFLTIFLDFSKGAWVITLIQLGVLDQSNLLPMLAYGVAGVVGHVYSIFMKFKGGKAVAASGGVFLAYNPIYALILIVVFFATLKVSRYVSIASSSCALGLVIIILIDAEWDALPYALVLAAIVLYRHKSNYINIKNGVEPKVKWMSKAE